MSLQVKLPRKGNPPPEMVLWTKGSIFLATLLYNRGLASEEAVDWILRPLARPEPDLSEFAPLGQAVARIEAALAAAEKIAVYGDYDVDGITATAVLLSAFTRLGTAATWHIPDRFSEGYGMDCNRIRQLASAGVSLIVTVDCGSSNEEEIQLANELGIDVIVTDHHLLPPKLPSATAILNFKALPAGHPSRDLPGVGTAYVLARELLTRRGLAADGLLDLVALGIIADVVPLVGHNRQLYRRGAPLLQKSPRPGLAALFAVANLPPEQVDEEKIGFQIAPRLNAAGRLASGKLGVELLLAQDAAKAEPLAQELNRLNLLRKELSKRILDCLQFEAGVPTVAYNPDWHQGVIGIAAGQIASRTLAPAILMTVSQGGGIVGSARSQPGLDIYQILRGCAKHLTKFGGHPAAAGFSLSQERLAGFQHAVLTALAEAMEDWRPPDLQVDFVVEAKDIGIELANQLLALAPCGEGNPPPLLYCRSLTVKSSRSAGSGVILTLGDRWRSFSAGLWEGGPAPEPGASIGAAFTLALDYFRGQQSVMATLKAWWPGQEPPITVSPSYTYLDWRGAPWRQVLNGNPQAAVYREGISWQDYPGSTRAMIIPAAVLVLLTPPPSLAVFRQILALVEPETVVLGFSAGEKGDFLPELLGVLKYICSQGGVVPLAVLAAALGETEAVILAALRLLAESRILDYELQAGKLIISQGEGTKLKAGPSRQALQILLQETAAFKNWLQVVNLLEIKKIQP